MDMTKSEKSLLLYCEARAVDHGSKLDQQNLNDEDRETLRQWNESGYLLSGRIASPEFGTWAYLSDKAWEDAAKERRARAERIWARRQWVTTAEKRAHA